MEVDVKVVFAKTEQDKADAIARYNPDFGPPKYSSTFVSKAQHQSINDGVNMSCTCPMLGSGFILVFKRNLST